eukprot:4862528-Prymnesium_polylepis.2
MWCLNARSSCGNDIARKLQAFTSTRVAHRRKALAAYSCCVESSAASAPGSTYCVRRTCRPRSSPRTACSKPGAQ